MWVRKGSPLDGLLPEDGDLADVYIGHVGKSVCACASPVLRARRYKSVSHSGDSRIESGVFAVQGVSCA